MLGQPKRNVKCPFCRTRGTCKCQQEYNAEAATLTTCTQVCQPSKGRHAACGRTIRGGACPCPFC